MPLLQFAEKGLFSDEDVVAHLDLTSSCCDTLMILKEALDSLFFMVQLLQDRRILKLAVF